MNVGHLKRMPAGPEDKDFVLGLRLSPDVAGGAFQTRGFDADAWWEAVRGDLWILRDKGHPVGYLITRPVQEISIVLAPEVRGKGVASQALRGLKYGDLVAFIRPKNKASIRAFEAAGFQLDEGRTVCEVYIKRQGYPIVPATPESTER